METISNFFEEVDKEFYPPLSSRVNINEYVEKMINNAVIFPIYESGEVSALLAMYCNDYESLVGFITNVAVKPNARGKGFGKLLIESACFYALRHGFKKIRLEVYKSNTAAISLYKKMGFVCYKEEETTFILEKVLS